MYLGNSVPPLVVCEIGCNHKGDLAIAKEMIKIAAEFCGIDVVKFQKRNNLELLTKEEYNSPHPVPANSFGDTYGEHREFLEFDIDQHYELLEYCEQLGVEYSSSVWDLTSAKEITSLNPSMIKVPSAINTNDSVLEYLFGNFKGEIHISLGMTTRDEEKSIVQKSTESGRARDVVLYHCVSGYPVALENLFLQEVRRLKEEYGETVKGIGFSGHHKGIAADIAALALGATYFERHFTLDRTWKGTDHAASLEPDGLRRLNRDLKGVIHSLHQKDEEIPDAEEEQRLKLKRSQSGRPI